MEKIIKFTIENTTKTREVEETYSELYSHDRNNGNFEFEIANEQLAGKNLIALFKFVKTGSYWKTEAVVEDNKAKIKFDTSLITQNEKVICFIYVNEEIRDADIFRFKFNVRVSEIDKAKQLPLKERFYAHGLIVDRLDVLTKEDFDKAIKEIEKGSKFLTEAQANEKYALKSDIPNIANLATTQELEKRALKSEIPSAETIVNKAVEKVEKKGYLTQHQSLAGYVTETQLNDKGYLTQHQSLANYVTETQLTEKGYLTKHQDISGLATKKSVEDVEKKVTQLENRPVTSSYDDSEIKRKLKELEDRPTTANVDTSNFVTNKQLEDKHYLTEHQPLTDYATKEDLRKAFLDEENHEKYAKKSELPQPYNDTDIKSRLTTLENRPAGSGNIDTSDFVEKSTFNSEIELLRTQTYTKFESPFKSSGLTRVEDYLRSTIEYSKYENFGRLYTDNYNNHLVVSGNGKTAKFETLLYTIGSSLPDNYEPDFEFGEGDNIKFITNKNISDYLPANTGNGGNTTELDNRLKVLEANTGNTTELDKRLKVLEANTGNTGNTGNTTELDNRLKVLEAKNWEIHGRGMPNGVVTAPVGTTYVDEAVTNGALKWIKKSGTGNVGWDVLIGDTGWKVLPSVSKLGGSYVKVRRVNNVVSYQFGGLSWGWFGIVRRGGAGYQIQPSDRERNCYILGLNGIPQGYRSESSLIGGIYNDKGTPYGTWYLGGAGDSNMLRFQFTDPVPTDRDIGDIRVSSISYLTSDLWPTN